MGKCLSCDKKINKVSYLSCYWLCQSCWKKVHNLGELSRLSFKEELKFKLQKKKKSASHF